MRDEMTRLVERRSRMKNDTTEGGHYKWRQRKEKKSGQNMNFTSRQWESGEQRLIESPISFTFCSLLLCCCCSCLSLLLMSDLNVVKLWLQWRMTQGTLQPSNQLFVNLFLSSCLPFTPFTVCLVVDVSWRCRFSWCDWKHFSWQEKHASREVIHSVSRFSLFHLVLSPVYLPLIYLKLLFVAKKMLLPLHSHFSNTSTAFLNPFLPLLSVPSCLDHSLISNASSLVILNPHLAPFTFEDTKRTIFFSTFLLPIIAFLPYPYQDLVMLWV